MKGFTRGKGYRATRKYYICTNPECTECAPGYAGPMWQAGRREGKCWQCGKPLRVQYTEPASSK